MRIVKYLFALWAAVLIYALLTLSFGARGAGAYRQLEAEKARQEANIESLKLINRELENTMNALLNDRDTLAVFARDQGYAAAGRRFIRIVGLDGYQRAQTSPGQVLVAISPLHISNRVLQIITFFIGITILLCMGIFDIMRFLRGE